MMLRKKLTILLLIVALICPMVFSAGSVQAASKVRLNKTKITLVVGQKKKLKVKGTKKKVKWSSSKKSVVSVSKKGVIKAKKKGKAVITARVGKKKLKCKVTVKKIKSALSTTLATTRFPTSITTTAGITSGMINPDATTSAIESTETPSESKSPTTTQPTTQPTTASTSSGDVDNTTDSIVYMTTDISSDGLMAAYKALGVELTGNNIAVKLSTGEPPASNYLDPNLIKDLVQHVDGTIVECNTAYGGSRSETAMHYQVAKDHGFTDIADVVIMDEDGSMTIPVNGGNRLSENYVGKHFADFDGFLVLSHFKGHAMAGFGGAIKNISIGIGSKEGKCLIHTAGQSHTSPWGGNQDAFLESMADAGKSVVDALNGNILYVNVMNRLSIDCDCDGNPSEPDIHDIGILASTDPVALDQACVDLIYKAEGNASFVRRMEGQNAQHVLEAGEKIGLGSRSYKLVSIDN